MLDILKEVNGTAAHLGKLLPDVPPRRRRAPITPKSKPQRDFLNSKADVVIYGGAAGGGKTWGLLVDPLKHIRVPGFGAVIFRRTYPQITNEGGLWDESMEIYPHVSAIPREGELDWSFRYDNKISFKHLQYDTTCLDYLGAQIAYIGFDQLELFSEYQFFYMLTRNRSTCGVKPRLRATVNPDADSWVATLIAWWIDQETGYAIEERSGVVRWFIRRNNDLIWGNSAEELFEKYGDKRYPRGHPKQSCRPKSLTFIPAKLEDNPVLMEKDPDYLANLLAQPLVEMERLLRGNWKIRPEAGKVFNRTWFEILDEADIPIGGIEVRFYDFAATEKKMKTTKSRDPDYTASCRMRYVAGIFYILDATAEQQKPSDTDRDMVNFGSQDGKRVKIRWEEEPGAAAKRDSARLVRMLQGYDACGRRVRGDKLTRAKGLASQARASNVKLKRADWNERWLKHMHGQPDLPHDDEMDAASGCYNEIVFGGTRHKPQSRTHSTARRMPKTRMRESL